MDLEEGVEIEEGLEVAVEDPWDVEGEVVTTDLGRTKLALPHRIEMITRIRHCTVGLIRLKSEIKKFTNSCTFTWGLRVRLYTPGVKYEHKTSQFFLRTLKIPYCLSCPQPVMLQSIKQSSAIRLFLLEITRCSEG